MQSWRERKERHGGWPLLLLMIVGIGSGIAGVALVAQLQAEALSAPGEAVWSTLSSAEMLDIARSSTFALGAIGGVAAFLLAYRRQKLNQATHLHEVESDKAEHARELDKQLSARIAGLHDRYTKSVEQLADDRASIRLGAVHAIEALAADWLSIDNHRQRQVCVNLLCSYLNNLEQPRGENSILRILEEYADADEAELRAESKAAAERLWDDRTVRKAILEALSDMLVDDHHANRDPVVVDLRNVTFRSGLELRKARLARLPLDNADLEGLALDGADLTGANLAGSLLGGAHLTDADLTDANLREADLSGTATHLDRALLIGADLRRANLQLTHLDAADLTAADLRMARLDGADLTNAILVRANLERAKVHVADLTNADLTGARLPQPFEPGRLRGAILTRGCQIMDQSKPTPTLDEWRAEARHKFGRKQGVLGFRWARDSARNT